MRVLLVEDDGSIATAVRVALEAGGHAVEVAADGPAGLWRATEFAYDLVLLDLTLPGLDGVEVCRRLRAAGTWTPVLVLTARGEDGSQVAALDAGADDYLRPHRRRGH